MRQVIAALALAALATAARADDGFKWNPSEQRERRVGARFAEELSKSDERTIKFAVDGSTKEERHEGTEKIRLIHSIAAATSAAVTEDRIAIPQWSRAWDKDADTTLEGALVTVKGEGAFRTSTTECEKPVSKAANRWLQSHVVKDGKSDPALDELDWEFILPKEPVADGGTWTIDPVAFAREVLGPGAAFDAKKSKGSGKLASVRVENGVHFGHVEVTVSLALEQLGASKVTWKKGGVQEFRYVLDLSLEPRRRDVVAGVITMELVGQGTVEPPGQDPVELELEEKSRLEVRRMPVE